MSCCGGICDRISLFPHARNNGLAYVKTSLAVGAATLEVPADSKQMRA